VLNLASLSTPLDFERPAFENAARYLNSETNSVTTDDGRMSSRSLVKFGARTPEILSCKRDPLKNLVQITTMCTRSTTNFQGQRVKGQGHSVTWRTSVKKSSVSLRKSATELLCAKTVSGRVVRHLLTYLTVHKQLVGDIPLNTNFVPEPPVSAASLHPVALQPLPVNRWN